MARPLLGVICRKASSKKVRSVVCSWSSQKTQWTGSPGYCHSRRTVKALIARVLPTRAYWVGHHYQFHFVRRVNWGLLWLNLLFLLFITLVPFSTNLLAGRSRLHLPVAIYGLNLLLLALVFLWHLRHLTRHPELAHEALTAARAAEVRRPSALVAFVAAASIAISFYKPNLALTAYWLLLAFHFLRVRVGRYPAADGE